MGVTRASDGARGGGGPAGPALCLGCDPGPGHPAQPETCWRPWEGAGPWDEERGSCREGTPPGQHTQAHTRAPTAQDPPTVPGRTGGIERVQSQQGAPPHSRHRGGCVPWSLRSPHSSPSPPRVPLTFLRVGFFTALCVPLSPLWPLIPSGSTASSLSLPPPWLTVYLFLFLCLSPSPPSLSLLHPSPHPGVSPVDISGPIL